MIDSGCSNITVMGTMHECGFIEGMIDDSTACNPLSLYGIAKNALRQMLTVYTKDKNISLKWLRAFTSQEMIKITNLSFPKFWN